MDAFTRRIDPEDSFDVGDDTSNSFDLTASSVSSSSSLQSFGVQSPPPNGGSDRDVDGGGTDQQDSRGQPIDIEDQSDHKHRRRPLYEAPEFVRRLNVFEEVDIGGIVTFECQVRAFPRPIIKWYKDDVEVPSASSSADDQVANRVQAEDHTGTDSSAEGLLRLVIRDACKEDEGAYRCKAENEEGVAATTGYLSVTGPAANQSGNGSQQQASPRINAVSTPPLLRAITEQQSMEEREAALYAMAQNEDADDEVSLSTDDVPILSTAGDWSTYAEYLQKAIDDDDSQNSAAGQQQITDNASGSDTSCELDDVDDVKMAGSDTIPSLDHASENVDAGIAIVESNVDSSRGLNNDDDDYVLTESTVNVVVVEGDNPEEGSVAAAVIGLMPSSEEAAAVSDAPATEVSAVEPRPPSPVELTGSFGKGIDAGTSDPAAVDSSSTTTGDGGNEYLGVDLVVVEPAADCGSPLTDAELERSEPDAGVASDASRRLDETAATPDDVDDSRPDTTEDDGEVFSNDVDLRGDATASRKTPSSPDRPFKLGGLLRDIFPGSSKPGKTPAAADAPHQQRSPASETGEDGKKLVETASAPTVAATSSEVADVGDAKRDRAGIEITWSGAYEWYAGWLDLPWVIYAAMAVLFTLIAAATEADPAWVVIAVLAASMIAFALFPPTTTVAASRSNSV